MEMRPVQNHDILLTAPVPYESFNLAHHVAGLMIPLPHERDPRPFERFPSWTQRLLKLIRITRNTGVCHR